MLCCGDAIRSGRVAVLVDQAAEDGPSSDPVGLEVGDGGRGGWSVTVRRELAPGLARTVRVVVLELLVEDRLGVGLVVDQDLVEDFAA
jgi:hypothetical protein